MIVRALCLAAVLVVALAVPAGAHNVTAGADLRIAQTIAGAEVTVVIKGTSRVPGPLRIGVIAYQPVSGLPVGLEVRSVEDGRALTGTAQAAADPQYVQVRVERTGPHELKLSAGGEVAVVPFRVLVERGSMGDFLIYGGLFLAALLLVGGLLTGATARPGRAMALAAGAAAGVTVAAMVIVFEPQLPPPAPDGAAPAAATPAAGGRPYAQARVETVPARPGAGEEFTLRLDLIDGSTGRPVDDLTVHHEALAHVVVTSEDGRYFRHVHPCARRRDGWRCACAPIGPGGTWRMPSWNGRIRAASSSPPVSRSAPRLAPRSGARLALRSILRSVPRLGMRSGARLRVRTWRRRAGPSCRGCSPPRRSRGGPRRSSWTSPPGCGPGSA
ncbi:hypothetical protein ACFQQB_51515 [Nonomuraea rubra]|uniref:hypothetical protein n=1 Tax=Nonomuraea rubra TaxID=46180 RepID=UPI0036159BEB